MADIDHIMITSFRTRRTLFRLLTSAGFAALLAVAVLAGQLTELAGTSMTLVSPAAGVAALWAVLARDLWSRWWCAVLLVGVGAGMNLVAGSSWLLAVALGGVGLLQAVVFAGLFARWAPPDERGPLLADLRSVEALLVAAGCASATGAVVGAVVLAGQSGAWSLLDLAIWLARNGVAMVLVVPLGLRVRQVWVDRQAGTGLGIWPRGWRAVELGAAIAATVSGHVLVFVVLSDYPIAFPLFALTAWVALRFDTALTAVRSVVVSTVAVAFTLAGTGPFAAVADIGARALIVQAYAGLGAALALALALNRDERAALLHRLRRSSADAEDRAREVQVLADASRRLLLAEDARMAVCEAIRDVTGADGVYLVEPDRDHLVSTAVVGVDMPPICLSADPSTSLTGWAFHTGEAVFVPDLYDEPRVSRALAEQLQITSGAWQPAVLADDRVVAIIGLVWHQPVAALPASVMQVLTVLGQEAARAIERGNLLEQLARAADRDQLTGLANRRRWDELSGIEVARAQRNRLPLTFLLLDLDHFKAYNDTLGHAAGDVLLREFAEAAAACLRDGDLIARWGGEEFAVALPNCTDQEARAVAERILAAVPHGQTATVGIAQWHPGETSDNALARADAALYKGKDTGRARAVIADRPAALQS